MDMVLGVFGMLGAVLRYLAFYTLFYAIGSCVLKVITWGRYPRVKHWRAEARLGFPLFDVISLFGLLCSVGIAIIVARLLN